MPFMSPLPPLAPCPAGWRAALARAGWPAGLATALYIALIAFIAQGTGFVYILFPELGALSHDILKRPHGAWARAPLLLVVTPFLTAVIGTFLTRHLPYGLVSVLFDVGGAILVIRLLKSPIAPAISAGLLPLVLGLKTWWYPPSLLIGTILLAAISLGWRRIMPAPVTAFSASDRADDLVEEAPSDYSWVPFFLAFLIVAILTAGWVGWRFILFPPLVVIGFEMFAHPAICPWAGRPLLVPVACALTATTGVVFVSLFGVGPVAAVCGMVSGIVILRICDLHIPPALAVGLLPFVIPHPNYRFPLAVAAGTLLLTLSFLVWRRLNRAARGNAPDGALRG
jgi:hypothetical protein